MMSDSNNVSEEVDFTISAEAVNKYFQNLINRFFKILPMKESEEETLPTYISSLQIELLGMKSLIPELQDNSSFLSLLAVLQYFEDNPDCETAVVRREVFNSISTCKHLAAEYADETGE